MLKRSQVVIAAGFRGAVRNSAVALTVALASLSWPNLAAALGLGDITLHSALSQPFNARIELIETDGLSNEDIIARLASPEAFAKAGIERVFFLNDLRFTPVVQGNRGFIEVTSRKPVIEPYLSFLVQVAQPNGDLLHEYTLLLDPPTSAQGMAATRSRQEASRVQAAQPAESRMPLAPPTALQGKHYSVTRGDTLSGIASRVQGPASKVSVAQMAEGIQALNPMAFPTGPGSPLKAGQRLLLPDSAVLPTPSNSAASSEAVQPVAAAEARRSAEQLASAALENQQFQQTIEVLKAQNQSLQEQLIERDKAVSVLQARLTEERGVAAAAASATPLIVPAIPAAQPAAQQAPAPAPVAAPVPAAQDSSLLSLPSLLGGLLLLLLALGLVYLRRRREKAEVVAPAVVEEPLIKPAQSTILPVYEIPAVAPQAAPAPAPSLAKAPAARRMAGAAADALDGVSIYIAYGRFNEAMGILRDALEKQPEREDIRVRILELLAEQSDTTGFERDAQAALDNGMNPDQIDAIRKRYPQLKAAPPAPVTPLAATATTAAVTAAGAAAASAAVASADASTAGTQAQAPAQLDETAAAALNPEHQDEFQLNLDDLSMDADWDLVDPFDKPVVRETPGNDSAAHVDPGFASNLNELPEVFELQDEQFLDDLPASDVMPEEPIESIELGEPLDLDMDDVSFSDSDSLEVVEPAASDELDDAFLDSFASDDGMEFDLLDLDEAPLTLINQAQVLIDEGDIQGARRVLLQVLDESDEAHQQMARDLLASL